MCNTVPRIRNPYAVAGVFRKAQLHCHTTESDGRISPRDLLRLYRDAGYAFVCITDHNRVTRCDDFNDGQFLALPGTEDTVTRWIPQLGPHMGRLLVDGPLHRGTAQDRIDRTRAGGGIVSLCHPSWTGNLWTGGWHPDQIRGLRGVHLFEVCNPHSSVEEDTRRWAAALRVHGRDAPVWAVAVDDCHRRDQFNRGWIMLKTPGVSRESFREALVGGAFYATTGPVLEVTTMDRTITAALDAPARIRFLDATGRVRQEADATAARFTVQGDESFIRIEATGGRGRLWSQPCWVEADGGPS